MRSNRMWTLAMAAALCTSPMWAQTGSTGATGSAGGSGQQGSASQSTGGPGSMAAGQDQPGMGQGVTQNTGSKGMDKAFVKKALGGSMSEVQMGKLALEKSSNDQVKQFAQKMVDDHTKLIDQMKPVAEQMGVTVPDSPPSGDMKKMDKMKSLNGDAFDKAYAKDMLADHKKDNMEFQREQSTTQDPQLKQVVTQGSQVIQQHLQLAQQLNQQVNGGGGKSSK